MSQQAAIRAEKERIAAQRRAQRERWIERARTWGGLAVGAVLLLVGVGGWIGAGIGADSRVLEIETMTQERSEELEQSREEFDRLWVEASSQASGVDLARVERDEQMMQELILPVAQGQDEASTAAQQAGIEDGQPYVAEFLAGREKALGGFDIPAVHSQDIRLHEVDGARITYVSVIWFTDLGKKAVNQVEPIEPAEEHSAWAVVVFTTGPDGQIRQIQAQWVQGPPLVG